MLRRWITLLMIAMLAVKAAAQSGTVYPIDLSVMMTPPYGTCLKEYVGSERITVQALLKDFSKSSTQFVLQLKVTDNRNKTVLMTHFGGYDFKPGQLFTYPMGGPNSGETSNILHDMFANATVQPRNECFEEGAYTFTFQAYDATTYPSRKIALSPAFTVPVFLQGNTVQPLQIYPYESEVICPNATIEYKKFGMKKESTKTDMINYQWQAANPTGMRVGYHLQVVDLGEIGSRSQQDIESSAQSGFGNSSPMIVDHRTYTPFYNHAFSAGNYVERHAYAWRVRALTGTDLETESSFADRTAPVRVFYICGFPDEVVEEHDDKLDERVFDKKLDRVKMDTVDSSSLNATAFWVDNVEVKRKYCGVSVEIRKKGQEKWTPYFVEMNEDTDSEGNALDNYYHFSNLNYNTRYEVRAQYVKCEGGSCAERTDKSCTYAPYSDTIGFVVPSLIDSAKCGDDLPKLTDCAGAGAPEVSAGDTIMANGMPVVLDSVHYEGDVSKGVISGRGHICFPIIKNIQMKMKFEKITINCAKELAKGEVVSVYDEQTCAMIDIDNLTGQGSSGAKDNPSGEAKTTPYTEENVKKGKAGDLFVDENDGNKVYMKTKDGKTEKIGKLVTFKAEEYEDRGSDMKNNEFHFVEFFNEDKVNNAFDNDEQNYALKVHDKDFERYAGGALVMPWLANNPGKMKTVKARELKKKGGEEHDDYESVLFIIPSATEGGYIQLDAQKDASGNYELHIPGWSDIHSSTPVTAIARTSATEPYLNAGRMMVGNYEEKTKDLVFVPVGKNYTVSESAKKKLNEIYGRLGVTFNITVDKVFNNDTVNALLDNGLDISADDESKWQVESSEMMAIRYLYQKSHPNMDKKAAYIFLVDKAEAPYEDVEGDMPRDQSAGFIFMKNATELTDGRLVAHELGHGLYKFQHLFDYKDMEDRKGTTDNLMDYNNGDFLAHFQWKIMQDPTMFVWKFLQGDEDGLSVLSSFVWVYGQVDGVVVKEVLRKRKRYIKNNLWQGKKEEKVEEYTPLFQFIYDNSKTSQESYYPEKVKGKNYNVVKLGYSSWTVSYGGNNESILRNIHENNSIELKDLQAYHIYVMNLTTNISGRKLYTLMNIYVFQDQKNHVIDKYKTPSLDSLFDEKFRARCAYEKSGKYLLVAFYDENSNIDIVVQISEPSRDAEEGAEIWAEYLLQSGLSSSPEDNARLSNVDKGIVTKFWSRKTDLFKKLSKEEYDVYYKNNITTKKYHVEHGEIQSQHDELSAKGHYFTRDEIKKLYLEKHPNEEIDPCAEERLLYFTNMGEDDLKSIYEWGNIYNLYEFPECIRTKESRFGGTGPSVSNADNLYTLITTHFYNKNLQAGWQLILRENSETSQALHYYPYFQKVYYFRYLEYLRKYLLENNMNQIYSVFERKELGLPDFTRSGDVIPYDFYGVFGGTQRMVLDLVVTEFDDFYLVDTKMQIEDWYGTDFQDFFGKGLKAKTACMNAFFMLQFRYGCSPFKTGIVYRDYNIIYKD